MKRLLSEKELNLEKKEDSKSENNKSIEIVLITGVWKKRMFFGFYIDEEAEELKLPRNSTVEDVLKMLGWRESRIGMITIKGEIVERNFVLSDGDILKIFPKVLGAGV